MSIFKETFRDFVFKQLRIREAIVKQGNNSTTDGSNRHANEGGGGRFGNPRITITTANGKKETKPLPEGSFFTNTIEKQCTIRMCSGVDLREENNIVEKGSKFENSKDLINEGLALRFILEGGVPTKSWDFKTKRKRNGGKFQTQPRGKLNVKKPTANPNFGQHYGTSYGDPYTRSDGDGDFGIVPMPGIIDANIRTKTAYGSLREAKVNFVCHNRRQLEIMELLYMRPGYPILLEWGWTPYISNEFKKEEYFPYLMEFFKQESKISDIQLKILKQKKSSGGNYDGFVGYCKNFDIKSREDGGYDCTTEIIAMGEVLEGLKGKRDGNLFIKEGEEYEIDELEFFLVGLQGFSSFLDFPEEDWANYSTSMVDVYKKPYKDSIKGKITNQVRTYDGFRRLAKFIDPTIVLGEYDEERIRAIAEAGFYITEAVTMERADKQREYASNEDREAYVQVMIEYHRDHDARGNKVIVEGSYQPTTFNYRALDSYFSNIKKISKLLEDVIIKKGSEVGIKGFGYMEGSNALHSYVRWDFLITLLNNFVFPQTRVEEDEPIIRLTSKRDGLGKINPTPLYYTNNFLPPDLQELVANHKEPGEELAWWQFLATEEITDITTTLSDITDISIDPKVCLFPHQITPTQSIEIRQIGLMYFNLEFLLKKFMELRYTIVAEEEIIDDDFTIFSFLKEIWDGANKACANTHNFMLQTELEQPDIIRVIDLMYDSSLQPEDLFEVKIQSNEAIVRDFNFNTTIPSAMGATIAIAAQAPKSIDSLESVTFAAFNKNTKFRFNNDDTEDIKELTPKQIKALAVSYDKANELLQTSIMKLAAYSRSILGYRQNEENNVSLAAASNYMTTIESKIIALSNRYSSDGIDNDNNKFYKGQQIPINSPPPKSAIIPLKFTAQLDGIGGIVIGNVFKVQKDRLPKGYQGDEIAFVVMGEDQKITSGQDWTTNITGQLILLNLPKDEIIYPRLEIIEIPEQEFEFPPLIEIMVPDKLRVDIPIDKDILIPPAAEPRKFVFTDVNFDTDKSELKSEAKEALDKFAEYMNAHSKYTVDISGHTDSVGSEAYNQSLSGRRAKAVENYFINVSGIDQSRLTSRGAGELEPIDTNDTSEGRSNNRRTVFLVQNPDGDVPMNVYFTL